MRDKDIMMMDNNDLATKAAYFEEQALLDVTDDEQDFPDNGISEIDRALKDAEPISSPILEKTKGSFLGPTPKERRAEFKTYSTQHRTAARALALTRSTTAPEAKPTRILPVTQQRTNRSLPIQSTNKLRRHVSLPDIAGLDSVPFYKRLGAIPRELRNGKTVRPADKIRLEPEHKQLLKGKIIYFYPNDDISMARRTRIHKVIQLGAAWVKEWRDDITHIMLDDANYTYSQLLRHLNKTALPERLILVPFDPYVPQCMEFGSLLNPTALRFAVKGAPVRSQSVQISEALQLSNTLQASLKIKTSRRQTLAQGTQETDSLPTEGVQSLQSRADIAPSSSAEDIVEDSFVVTTSGPAEPIDKVVGESDRFNDALSQAIKETMAFAHLPLDDEDMESRPRTPLDDNVSYTDEEHSQTVAKPRKQPAFVSKASALRDKSLKLNTFQCMDPDHWRTYAYRRGIATLKKQSTKITTAEQAAALPFIGQRLAEKIEEIVLTNRLRKLDSTKDDPLDSLLRLFLGVYGAGLVQANKWIQAGYRSLEDLRTKAKITESHRIGLEHYDDFNSRIPRAEVRAHGAVVKAALTKIDPRFEATIMGSYRRGAKDSGDIDMMITCPGAPLSVLRTVVFDSLVPKLFNAGFLKASLATWRSNDGTGTKWHGASCLPTSKIWRRIDLLLVPEDEMGAALIYFTGNDIFNRSIRLLARKKKMRLNQRGLYKDVNRDGRGTNLNEGELVEGRSEKKIFELLGVPWREPHERLC
ncbi:hypothetical protein ACEQ8H_005559 [Pleosporales sp. CAS-2024a]